MPRRPRKTKGQQPRKPKTDRHEWEAGQRMTSVILSQKGCSAPEINETLAIPEGTIRSFKSRYNTKMRRRKQKSSEFSIYVDKPRSGRPSYPDDRTKRRIFRHVISTVENRKKTAQEHIQELHLIGTKRKPDGTFKLLSESTFKKIMYDRGYSRGSHCWRPMLTEEHRKMRLEFAQKYIKFDWKNRAVSTDEAKAKKAEYDFRAIWRAPGEETRSELVGRTDQEDDKAQCMISAHFCWKRKGAIIFLWDETKKQREEAHTRVMQENANNAALHTLAFASVERWHEEEFHRTGKKRKGRAPQLCNYTKSKEKTRGQRDEGHVGVDAYRYAEEVLHPYLLPFCKKLEEEGQKQGLKVCVMQDKAKNHTSAWPKDEFSRAGIAWFVDWPPHSPDLNPIERAWDWCRHYLQEHGYHAETDADVEKCWREAWEALPEELIHKWFEEMPDILQKVIDHNGDNDFQI